MLLRGSYVKASNIGYFLVRDPIVADKATARRAAPADLHERSVLVAPAHAVTFAAIYL